MNAPAKYALPQAADVKSLLGMLFDGLTVKPGSKMDLSPASSGYCAVFVAADGVAVAFCACDIAFASNAGAALSALPPGVAKEAAKAKTLTDVMIANLREVMNICTRLLLKDGTPHLRLDQVYAVKALPAAASGIVSAGKNRVDFEVTLEKYGPGVITVISV